MNEFIESVKNAPVDFKNFIIENGRNPILWIALFFIGVFIFFLTFNALNKNK